MNTSEEANLVKIVAEDLKYMKTQWDEEITDASLRISSGILRRLLVEDEYGNAWRTKIIGFVKQPSIIAVDSDQYMLNKEQDIKKIKIAVMGGAKYKGTIIQGFRFVNYTKSPTNIAKDYERTKYLIENPRKYKLNEFLDSTSCIIEGKKISRREIIQYVTNKKGGVHIDFKRNRQIDKKFKLIDESYSLAMVDKNYIYYELLSIGQLLANSDDAKLFVNKALELRII